MTTRRDDTLDSDGEETPPAVDAASESPAAGTSRKRPKPGERRVQILQTLAGMLEQPGSERVTTAALAARLGVSEAALYRHFASKAQMFEGLIEFIETSFFSLANQISEREPSGVQQARKVVTMLLQFGERNPGMAHPRVRSLIANTDKNDIVPMRKQTDCTCTLEGSVARHSLPTAKSENRQRACQSAGHTRRGRSSRLR